MITIQYVMPIYYANLLCKLIMHDQTSAAIAV